MKSASAGTAPADLMSMLKRTSGKASKSSARRRHPLATTDEGGLHLGVRRLGDVAGAVGDPVQHVVVEGEQDTVAGDVDVGLEVGVAETHGVTEGRHRVLQALDLGVVGTAAVGEGQDACMVEVATCHASSMAGSVVR